MAVYTDVSDEDMSAFIAQYGIGDLVSAKGIAEGVENSNYLIRTTQDTFILTLYEKRVKREDLPFFIGLMNHLAEKGLPCPRPIEMPDGTALRDLNDRPAAVTSFLEGMWARRIRKEHCEQLGAALADLHAAGADFPMQRRNGLTLGDWRPLFEKSEARAHEVHKDMAPLIRAELDFLEANWPKDLPIGVCHADMFPDNVFFIGDRLSGVIDLSNYAQHRPLTSAEIEALPILARGSAMRFLLTRLYDWLNCPPGALVRPHDPMDYFDRLRFHQGVSAASAYGFDGS